DTILELFAGMVAIITALVGYKAYGLTHERKFFWFGTAFGFITLSFLARALTTLFISYKIETITSRSLLSSLADIGQVFVAGRFAYVLLVLSAYLVLFLLSTKQKDKLTIALLCVFVILFSAFSYASSMAFYLAALALLVFITANHLANYQKRRSQITLGILLAFTFMIVEYLFFIAALKIGQLTVGAYLSRLLGYATLLMSIVSLGKTKIKNEKKQD
ncbi:MAG: hypothetical protein QXN46_00320, partial [Candidatus Woesearchaeota archaeon]